MSDLIDRQALLDSVYKNLPMIPSMSGMTAEEMRFRIAGLIENALPASPWHRVEEELPSMDGYDWVLGVVTGEAGYLRFHKAVMMVSFDPQYKEWFIDEYPDARITVSHWMLLPEPPKEDA